MATQPGCRLRDSPALRGTHADRATVFTLLSRKAGEQAMVAAKLNQTHKDLLQYFSSMILDPDGHKKWMDEIRETL